MGIGEATVQVAVVQAGSILMRGGGAIVSPLGKVLAGPHFGGETILAATLDLHDIGRGKFDFTTAARRLPAAGERNRMQPVNSVRTSKGTDEAAPHPSVRVRG